MGTAQGMGVLSGVPTAVTSLVTLSVPGLGLVVPLGHPQWVRIEEQINPTEPGQCCTARVLHRGDVKTLLPAFLFLEKSRFVSKSSLSPQPPAAEKDEPCECVAPGLSPTVTHHWEDQIWVSVAIFLGVSIQRGQAQRRVGVPGVITSPVTGASMCQDGAPQELLCLSD